MMRIVVAIIFISVGDILGTLACNSKFWECSENSHGDIPKDFPKNKEELDHACRVAEDMLKCELDSLKNCIEEEDSNKTRDKEMLRKIVMAEKQMLNYTREFCDPQSSTYKVAVNNIGCLASALQTDAGVCEVDDEGAIGKSRMKVKNHYEKIFRKAGVDDARHQECMNSTWVIACRSAIASEKCGLEMLNPFADAVYYTDIHILYDCLDSIEESLVDVLPEYALAILQAGNTANTFLLTHTLVWVSLATVLTVFS